VGAGIVGAACAEALAEAGCRVEVWEGGLAGAGVTAASMGHVVMMDDSRAQLELSAWSRRRWAERATDLPAECEDAPCGTLWLARDDGEMDRLGEKRDLYHSRGEPAELMGREALQEIEPQLDPSLAGALRTPEDRVVYPPAVTRHLLERARGRGAVLRERAAVEAVERGRIRAHGSWHEADFVIMAAGAASARLVPALRIEPRRGHLVITDRYPGFLRHQVIEVGYHAHAVSGASVACNVQPRRSGQLLIGSSRELVGWDTTIDHGVRGRMLRRASEYVPGLRRLRALRTWVGFRPATPDGLPLVGEWEPGLIVAAGHEGLGVTTSLGTAQIVADLALEREMALDPRPYDPRRPEVVRG
jgi:glycine/D-amino acid oxidase-like deaminating enzyme